MDSNNVNPQNFAPAAPSDSMPAYTPPDNPYIEDQAEFAQRMRRQALKAKGKWSRPQPEQQRAWRAVRAAIRCGKIVAQTTCELCGSPDRVQAHHSSYAPGEELHIAWLCHKCHSKADNARRMQNLRSQDR